jgi:hypothetical protein
MNRAAHNAAKAVVMFFIVLSNELQNWKNSRFGVGSGKRLYLEAKLHSMPFSIVYALGIYMVHNRNRPPCETMLHIFTEQHLAVVFRRNCQDPGIPELQLMGSCE